MFAQGGKSMKFNSLIFSFPVITANYAAWRHNFLFFLLSASSPPRARRCLHRFRLRRVKSKNTETVQWALRLRFCEVEVKDQDEAIRFSPWVAFNWFGLPKNSCTESQVGWFNFALILTRIDQSNLRPILLTLKEIWITNDCRNRTRNEDHF